MGCNSGGDVLGYEFITAQQASVNGFTVKMPAGRAAVSAATGGGRLCVILDDGDVVCHLQFTFPEAAGALGAQWTQVWTDGETNAPRLIGGASGRKAVSLTVGGDHACAVLDDGTVACWSFHLPTPVPKNDFSRRPMFLASAALGRGTLMPNGAETAWGPDVDLGGKPPMAWWTEKNPFDGPAMSSTVGAYFPVRNGKTSMRYWRRPLRTLPLGDLVSGGTPAFGTGKFAAAEASSAAAAQKASLRGASGVILAGSEGKAVNGVAISPPAAAQAASGAPRPADFTNDGKPDILLAVDGGHNLLYHGTAPAGGAGGGGSSASGGGVAASVQVGNVRISASPHERTFAGSCMISAIDGGIVCMNSGDRNCLQYHGIPNHPCSKWRANTDGSPVPGKYTGISIAYTHEDYIGWAVPRPDPNTASLHGLPLPHPNSPGVQKLLGRKVGWTTDWKKGGSLPGGPSSSQQPLDPWSSLPPMKLPELPGGRKVASLGPMHGTLNCVVADDGTVRRARPLAGSKTIASACHPAFPHPPVPPP